MDYQDSPSRVPSEFSSTDYAGCVNLGYSGDRADVSTSIAQGASLRSDLLTLFKKAKLPTSPTLAASILELANDPKSSLDQFANLIKLDPVLSGRLLKMANSAQFFQRSPVTSIPRAVTVLGLNRVRNVALGFQLVGHVGRLGNAKLDFRQFWRLSLIRGCLAREIAQVAVPDLAEEAFLCGLLQDCGILLLVQLLGSDYARLYESANLSPTAFFEAEQRQFEYTHCDAIRIMAEEWGLPRTIAMPIARHHLASADPSGTREVNALSAVSFLVGSLRLVGDQQVAQTEPMLTVFAAERLNLDPSALRTAVEKAGVSFAAVGSILSESLPADLDVTDLLCEANLHLTRSAGQAEDERQRFKASEENLRHELGHIREQAARDPLTGVLHRGALLEAAGRIHAGPGASGVAVYFLDIDNFKRFNDGYGHTAGDAVLKGVARTLDSLAPTDACLGRFGGEEFVLVLPCPAATDAEAMGERIVEAVRATKFAGLNLPGPVTCSVGAVWAAAGECADIQEQIALADSLMYRAKRAGKNQSRFSSAAAAKLDSNEDNSGDAVQAVAAVLGDSGVHPQTDVPAVPAHLRIIAKELNSPPPKAFLEMRKQGRKPLMTPCQIRCFSPDRSELLTLSAYVRNISTGGIGLLTSRAFTRCEPIEVAILSGGSVLLYVAGLVSFCAQLNGKVHDVGLQITVRDKAPIFPNASSEVFKQLPWVKEALDSLPPNF